MHSTIHKNTKLLAVRDAAMQRLIRFAKSNEADVKHSYLFSDDKFAGVRYRVGAFIASWSCGEMVVSIHRGTNLIDQFPLQADQQKAA